MGNGDGVWQLAGGLAGGLAIGAGIVIAARIVTATMEKSTEKRLQQTLAAAERFFGAKTQLRPNFRGIDWSMEPSSKWREFEEWKRDHETRTQKCVIRDPRRPPGGTS